MTRFILTDRGGTSEPVPNPERLSQGSFGPLLKEANRELASDLDQRAAFQRLTERLSPSPPVWQRPSTWLVPATVLVLAAFAAVPAVVHRVSREPAPLVAAEDLRGYQPRTLAVVPSATQAPVSASPTTARANFPGNAGSGSSASARFDSPASARFDLPDNDQHDKSSVGPSSTKRTTETVEGSPESESGSVPRRDAHVPEPQRTSIPEPLASAGPPRAPKNSAPKVAESDAVTAAPDCLSLARRGHTRDAEACFVKTAEGTGLAAEMALYEVARLRRDVLSDPPGALQALAEYRKRFPSGSLRREADMSHLELLLQLGRSDEALKQSEQLLSSSSSGERAAELHLLRGHILRKAQARFAEAAHEYELAERAGARTGDVTYFRALCLEALGQKSEAAALFSQYLEQSQHPYASDARKRLERLKP